MPLYVKRLFSDNGMLIYCKQSKIDHLLNFQIQKKQCICFIIIHFHSRFRAITAHWQEIKSKVFTVSCQVYLKHGNYLRSTLGCFILTSLNSSDFSNFSQKVLLNKILLPTFYMNLYEFSNFLREFAKIKYTLNFFL